MSDLGGSPFDWSRFGLAALGAIRLRRLWAASQKGHLRTWEGYAAKGSAHDQVRETQWRALLEVVGGVAPVGANERVLDIGCGLDSVVDFLPNARVHTLDSLMHRLSRFGLPGRSQPCTGLFETLPYRSGSFDRVFVLNVLDHVWAPQEGLAEVARILRPGGTLVLSVDTYEGARYRVRWLRKSIDNLRGVATKHPWIFSNAAVLRRLRKAGFAPGADPVHVPGYKDRRQLFIVEKASS